MPSALGLNQDQRRLGVAVREVRVSGMRTIGFRLLTGPGWHAAEPDEGHTQTDGHALLPACFAGRTIDIVLSVNNTYAEPEPPLGGVLACGGAHT